MIPSRALAVSARLSWTAVGNASGYKIYVRPSGGSVGAGVDVGGQAAAADGHVTFTLANVDVGSLLSVSSYDAGGTESARSNELSLPAPAPTATRTAVPVVVATATKTAAPTATAQRTAVPTVTATPVRTAVPTVTPTPVQTALPTATATAVRTAVPTVTATATAVRTAVPTVAATTTAVPTVTATPQRTLVPPTATAVQPSPIETPPGGPLTDLSRAGTIIARVTAPTGGGNHDVEVIRDGDRPPVGNLQSSRQYDTYDGSNQASEDWIGYAFAGVNRFRRVVFQEGRHFWNGGWFDSLTVQVRQNGIWVPVQMLTVAPAYPGVNAATYQTFTMSFTPIVGDAIRIYGRPGGIDAFISVGELLVLGDGSGVPPVAPSSLSDITGAGAIVARVTAPTGGGNRNIEVIRDGDMPPQGTIDARRQYDTYDGANAAAADWIGYTFATPQRVREVVFKEGMHFWNGGWFDTLTVQVLQNGQWVDAAGLTSTPVYLGGNTVPYETFILSFAPVIADGIRLYGQPGGSADFISVGELRVYAEPAPVATAAAESVPAPTPAAGADTAAPAIVSDGAPAGASAPAPDAGAPVADVGAPVSLATPQPPTGDVAAGTCGDGRRDDAEECDGADDDACPAACHADCTCPIVVELPLGGWSPTDESARAELVEDEVTGALALAVRSAAPANDAEAADAGARMVFPEAPSLDLPLTKLAVRARALAPYDVEAVVRGADEREYVLVYRAGDAAPAPADDRAVIVVGAALAGGEIATIARDLDADLQRAFGVSAASVQQVRVRGTVTIFRVALASDFAPGEDTAARLELPLAGWERRGLGTVVENAYDPALPGLSMTSDPSEQPLSLVQLSYPAAGAGRVLPFGRLTLAVRDAEALAIEVKGVVSNGDDVEVTYETDRAEPQLRLRRAALPLALTARERNPYADVVLDVAGAVGALDPGVSLAAITSVQLRGGFTVGDVQLRDPIAP